MKTLGIIEACFCSPAFRANAGRRLRGRPLLEWVVRRVTDSMQLSGVIVVACEAIDYHSLCGLVPMDVPVHQSNAPDMLARLTRALEHYPAEAVVRVPGDNLFIDPALIDRLITIAESLEDCDYAGYGSRDGRPAVLSPVGVYAEWFRATALRRANRAAKTPHDRRQPTRYIYAHPDKFNVKWIPAPEAIDRDDVRLTIANDDDWDHALTIFDALGTDALDWQRIAGFLNNQPAMRKRMAALNRTGAGT
ncbi:MAG: NTP transferase domain-containing protein [Thermoguttaceae bacterium]|jgi:spore coat polysaccharide biosynthesis protein SpsF